MASASWALQKAIFAAMTADANLTAKIGVNQVFDDVPRDTDFPYVTFGQSEVRDWATGTEAGHEHTIVLNVWSRENGRREVHDVMDAVVQVLHLAEFVVEGHRLINLRHELSQARREPDGETYLGTVRFRAVTEPLPA